MYTDAPKHYTAEQDQISVIYSKFQDSFKHFSTELSFETSLVIVGVSGFALFKMGFEQKRTVRCVALPRSQAGDDFDMGVVGAPEF